MSRFLSERRARLFFSLACVFCMASVAILYFAASAWAQSGCNNPEPCKTSCCGSACLGPNDGCCNGTVYNVNTQACCEGNVYNPSTQSCCGSGSNTLVYTTATQACCGSGTNIQVYTTATEGCCCAPPDGEGTVICVVYETADQFCCASCGCPMNLN
jgi:hypothetical protein